MLHQYYLYPMNKEQKLPHPIPSNRTSAHELSSQNKTIFDKKLLIELLDSISQMVVVLNSNREIIYANEQYLEFCKISKIEELLGMRPGESIECKNADKSEDGCGTSSFCINCGALNAILSSQSGVKSTKECSISTIHNNVHELRVTAAPLLLNGNVLTIFSILDISAEKRKDFLESVFLHDILNSSGGIQGLAGLLKEMSNPAEMAEIGTTIENVANDLIEEIKKHQLLSVAESGELTPSFTQTSSLHILENINNMFSGQKSNKGKTIQIDNNTENITFKTDTSLLKRVLANMVKNAIESNCPHDLIRLKAARSTKYCRLSVHNNSYISPEVRLKLFQRNYTTKGKGRGLGTYSMKLLGERYLKGNVGCESEPDSGTSFYIELPLNDNLE